MKEQAGIINERLALIRAAMREREWDGFWISSAENHRYVTDYHNPDGQVLITLDGAYVFADFRYFEAASREIPDELRVVMPEGPRSEWLAPYAAGLCRIGFEDERLTCHDLALLQRDVPGAEFVPAGNLMTDMRRIKTDDEIACIVKAQRIAEEALARVLALLHYDMTETEVAAELEYQMKKLGAEDKSFDTIAVSGSNSSSPHGVPRPVKLERGFLTMDFGALYRGYHSDMTRTVVIGKADADIRRLYHTVLEAQTRAIEAITEGASNFEMDKIARDIIENAGYHGCFGHSLGHGVGLEIHELPLLAPRIRGHVLHAGEVVTAEPGIYLAGKYGCRIEDMIHILPGGSENLTLAPKDLIEI